jgi:hypothetical protein
MRMELEASVNADEDGDWSLILPGGVLKLDFESFPQFLYSLRATI